MLVIFLTALTRAVVDVPTVRLVNGVAPGSVVLMPVMAGGTGERADASVLSVILQ